MNVILNGKPVELGDEATVADAVITAGHTGHPFGIAVALNGEVVARAGWAEASLSEGDKVEVLIAAQGG